MTSKIVFEITRLWFCTTTYLWEDKHESQHFIKKELHQHHGRQERCADAQRWNMDEKTNHSRSQDDMKKPGGRRNYYIGKNMMEWNKRIGSAQGTRKERWTSIERE